MGLVQGQGRDAGAGAGHQGVEGAFQLAHAVGEAVGQELQHLGAKSGGEAVLSAQSLQLALQDAEAQRSVGRLDAADQAGGKVRAQARIDLGQRRGRPVGGEHHPAAVLHQGRQGVEQLLLGRLLAADEMNVVDQQQVGAAQLILEGGHLPLDDRAHEGGEEPLGGQIDDLAMGRLGHGFAGQGVEQVGLAEAIGAVEHHGIEEAVGPGGDAPGHGMGELIGRADHEGVEGEAILQDPTGARLGRLGRRRRIGGDRLGGEELGAGLGDAASGLELHARLEGKHPTFGVMGGPKLADPAPRIALDPVAGEAGGRDQAQHAVGRRPQRSLGQPGTIGVVAQLGLQRMAGLGPDGPRRH